MQKTKLPERCLDIKVKEIPGQGLSGKFVFPPFSIFRAASGEWQLRKRQWMALGIQSETGRGENITIKGQESLTKTMKHNVKTGTSIFDPVLCELMYLWFCPKNSQVIDPFAGGSVRGIVARYMGFKYWGGELRSEQVEANIQQGKRIIPENPPVWVCGDSLYTLKDAPKADFIFSCPPYGNLEMYSEEEGDISNMEYPEFVDIYSRIIKKACRKLKDNRFACFVVSNFRDKAGFYHNLVGDTVVAFEKCKDVGFYNDAILVTATGSLPVRVGRQFSSARKLGKTHQNILIFYKGDPKRKYLIKIRDTR